MGENLTLWHSLSGSSEQINETEPRDIEENTCYDPFDNGPQPGANGEQHSWIAQSITWEEEKAGVQEQDSLALPSCGDSNRLL